MWTEKLNEIIRSYGFKPVNTEKELKEEIEEQFAYTEPPEEKRFIEELLYDVTQAYSKKTMLFNAEQFIGNIQKKDDDMLEKRWWLENMVMGYDNYEEKFELFIDSNKKERMIENVVETESNEYLEKIFKKEEIDELHLKKIFELSEAKMMVRRALNDKNSELNENESVVETLEKLKSELTQVMKEIYRLELESRKKTV